MLKNYFVIAVAAPAGYWMGSTFLQEFAFRIAIGWEIMAASILFVLLLGTIAVGSQTWKVAVANPVKNLRTE